MTATTPRLRYTGALRGQEGPSAQALRPCIGIPKDGYMPVLEAFGI